MDSELFSKIPELARQRNEEARDKLGPRPQSAMNPEVDIVRELQILAQIERERLIVEESRLSVAEEQTVLLGQLIELLSSSPKLLRSFQMFLVPEK